MRILALNPPFLQRFSRESRSPAVTKSGTLYYPMWLAYAVGYLEKQGHEVMFIDAPATGKSIKDVIEKAASFSPRLAILDSSTPSIYNDIDVACRLKQGIGDMYTMLVGAHVSALPRETLVKAPGQLDAVAVGEYDATAADLAALVERGGGRDTFSIVKGLAYRNERGDVIVNERRELIENLDDIPFVSSMYKKHLDISPYFYGHSRHPLVVIVTGRGCPFHCTFCVVPQTLMGNRYRKRSIESVAAEFRYIAENFHQVREIMIEDDTLTSDRKRCRELAQALIDTGATRVPWSANARADVDYETMRMMKRANCRLFCVGFESGEQRILDNIKKATTIDVIRRFMKDARRAGILIHGCFMVGNRGESRSTLEKTLQFAKQLGPDTAQFYPIMVYPGTADYEYYREKGWMVTDNFRQWLTEEGLHSSVVSNPDISYEYLVGFCDRARREFYMRPSYIMGKGVQMIFHPGEAKRLFMGGRSLMRYIFKPSLKNTKALHHGNNA